VTAASESQDNENGVHVRRSLSLDGGVIELLGAVMNLL